MPANKPSKDAWETEFEVMRAAISEVEADRTDTTYWSIIFEYEFPLEGREAAPRTRSRSHPQGTGHRRTVCLLRSRLGLG